MAVIAHRPDDVRTRFAEVDSGRSFAGEIGALRLDRRGHRVERDASRTAIVQPRDGETGLAVTWLHYRGPGSVTFDPMTTSIKPEGADLTGKATTTVHFSEPGTYVIRAVGDDGHLTNGTNVTV